MIEPIFKKYLKEIEPQVKAQLKEKKRLIDLKKKYDDGVVAFKKNKPRDL